MEYITVISFNSWNEHNKQDLEQAPSLDSEIINVNKQRLNDGQKSTLKNTKLYYENLPEIVIQVTIS